VHEEKYGKEIDELVSESSMMDKHSISYASLAMRNRNNHSKLVSDCKNDFLLIQGELDTIIPLDVMLQQIEKIDIQFKIIKNAGHMAHLESRDEVLHTISAFLNG
jgi:pimeloyl-ACP methyl ester carboxylesterase